MTQKKSGTKSGSNSPNSTISATSQMMILGMNSNDETPTESVRESALSSRRSSWFSRFISGNAKEEEEEVVEEQQCSNHGYSAMGDESQRRHEITPRNTDPLQRLSPQVMADLQYAALGEETKTENFDGFFFRSTDTINGGSPVWKTIRRNNRHGEVFEYSDALETIPAPVLQRYRTRYAQLNQDIQLRDDDDDDDEDLDLPDDLQLTNHQDDIVSFSTIPQSSLVYEADGKRLMRLPRDRVRLLMDPDLEPGILSMEQGTDEEAYVLTVDEDLYRKIVMEMSPRYFQETKLDIRFAYIVLVIILLILFVNTVAFHEF